MGDRDGGSDSGEKDLRALVVSRDNQPPVLNSAEHDLDPVSVF